MGTMPKAAGTSSRPIAQSTWEGGEARCDQVYLRLVRVVARSSTPRHTEAARQLAAACDLPMLYAEPS